MARLVLVEFVTLDGVMQGFGSPDEDRDGGFDHGGWGAPYREDVAPPSESLAATTAYLLGGTTYDKMVEFWPHQDDTNQMAAHLNATPKYVVTSRDDDLTWNNAHALRGDVDDLVIELKRRLEGDIVVLGSWTLAEQLIAGRHVDAYRLFVHPLLLGTGKRLF